MDSRRRRWHAKLTPKLGILAHYALIVGAQLAQFVFSIWHREVACNGYTYCTISGVI